MLLFCPSFLGTGKTRARDAALNAIQSPLLDIGIERATGIVWNITGGTDLTLYEVPFLLIGIKLPYQNYLHSNMIIPPSTEFFK